MKCFVIMPFGNRQTEPDRARELDLLYDRLIKPAVESVAIPGRPGEHVVCHRGDKEPRPGEVITHIIENLVSADIAIADLTGRNANVFYELGVRHAVNDNTILIARTEEDIPFDLRGQRFFIYRLDLEGGLLLRDALVQAIEDILKAPKRVDNPVRRYLFDQEKEKIEARGTPPGYDVVKELLAEVASLRREFKEQLAEVRHIMNAVTGAQEVSPSARGPSVDLRFLEGVWRAKPSDSLLCARLMKNGELLVPYAYGNAAELTGHYFNFRLIGDNLFARFAWLNGSAISGYALMRVESINRLVGGWWYSEDVPEEMLRDGTRIDHSLPGANKMVLERIAMQDIPWWAEDYFKEREAELSSAG